MKMSFPRKRESRTKAEIWIPTFVGMTGTYELSTPGSLDPFISEGMPQGKVGQTLLLTHFSIQLAPDIQPQGTDRGIISYAVFCLKKKKKQTKRTSPQLSLIALT